MNISRQLIILYQTIPHIKLRLYLNISILINEKRTKHVVVEKYRYIRICMKFSNAVFLENGCKKLDQTAFKTGCGLRELIDFYRLVSVSLT